MTSQRERSDKYVRFDSYDDLLRHIRGGGPVYYQAPLDYRPRYVVATTRGMGRKIRIDPLSNQADPFWADESHLDRFLREARSARDQKPARKRGIQKSRPSVYEVQIYDVDPEYGEGWFVEHIVRTKKLADQRAKKLKEFGERVRIIPRRTMTPLTIRGYEP